ncbi:integrase core domain-containing protein [Streptosporangium album]|uniref:integrase core domain-containing protein n=1 Tax=Streptosporangium album TaxID=47479 RepID=UPI003CD092C3
MRAPWANAIAEHGVGSVRRECTDRLLIAGHRHLQRVLIEFVDHYNTHRPHHGLAQTPPDRGDDLAPRATFVSYCKIDSAASSASTRRSHQVTRYSAPTPPCLAEPLIRRTAR